MRFYTMPAEAAKRGRIAAWLVHLYTAAGAVLALAGVEAVLKGDARLAFASMYAATIVDATDGVLARRARVKSVLPGIDGARIDDLVDYVTFVFLPMIVVLRFELLPQPIAFSVAGWCWSAACMASWRRMPRPPIISSRAFPPTGTSSFCISM